MHFATQQTSVSIVQFIPMPTALQAHQACRQMLTSWVPDSSVNLFPVWSPGQEEGGEATGAESGAVADMEVIMDLLTLPGLRAEAERVFERCVAKGLFSEAAAAAVLERRRMQYLLVSAMPPAPSWQGQSDALITPPFPAPGGAPCRCGCRTGLRHDTRVKGAHCCTRGCVAQQAQGLQPPHQVSLFNTV